MIVTLYTQQIDPFTLRVVQIDTAGSYLGITWYTVANSGTPTTIDPAVPVAQMCSNGMIFGDPQPYDLFSYYPSATAPYATATVTNFSTFCGYIPPTCDIFEKSFTKTDETAIGADDGTANMFAVSSAGGIVYTIYSYNAHAVIGTNSTGYFTALPPSEYFVTATDANGCTVTSGNFFIVAKTTLTTHYKYKLAFKSIDNLIDWECKFFDMRNNYDYYTYPISINGTERPVIKKTDDPEEDKTSVILSTKLTINLVYDGTTFTPAEFSNVPEKSWKVELWKNGEIDFQGWLLPDEIQDYYADPLYEIEVTATDGLPSLKGNVWGDGSGGQGYSTFQIQQYGVTTWCNLVDQCLQQLGYYDGNVWMVNSLQHGGAYDINMWTNLGVWADILYDGSGNAVDTYTALTNLLGAVKLTIFQHKGSFYFVNWNDLFYVNTPLKAAQFYQSFYRIDIHGLTVLETGLSCYNDSGYKSQAIGFGSNKPINPMQTLNFDKAYNMEVDISFNILALLYENPSFEYGSVQGELPMDWTSHGTNYAYVNYDPVVDGVIGSGAYNGVWELKVKAIGNVAPVDTFIETPLPFFPIDQPGKLLNISFQWKVPQCFITILSNPVGYVFAFTPVFIEASTGIAYFLQQAPCKSVSYQDYLINRKMPVLFPTEMQWVHLDGTGVNYSEGDAASIKGYPINDYTAWNNFSVTAPPFPGSQTGTVSIRFYGVKGQILDTSKYITIPPDNRYSNSFYIDIDVTDTGYYLIDNLNVTLSDASPTSTLQTGETHITTAVTGVPNANLKNVPLALFTYPNNKTVAGNVFDFADYLTGAVANNWNFALATADKQDRLPATVVRAIARNYSRPMYIFEGDIEANYLQFFSVFFLEGYANKCFMPFSVEVDCRNCVCHVILVEIDDTPAQFIYSYIALYENNARQISSTAG